MWIFSVSAVYFSVRLSRVDSWRVILGGRILAYYMGVVGNTTWIVLLHRLNVSVFCFPKPFEIATAEVKEVLTTLRSRFCAIFLGAMTESMNCEGKPRYLSLVAIVSTRFVSALHCWVTFWWLSNYLLIWLRFQLCFGQLSKLHPLIKTVMWLKAAADFSFCLRRLAKSTLLLIPLFGIHYVVFVSPSESIAEDYKIFFDLALGSFQVPYF